MGKNTSQLHHHAFSTPRGRNEDLNWPSASQELWDPTLCRPTQGTYGSRGLWSIGELRSCETRDPQLISECDQEASRKISKVVED